MTQMSFLTVEIAGQLVALNVDAVQAVLPMDEIVAVPLAPPTVVGITTKRGHVLTVVDARAAITRRHLPAPGQGVRSEEYTSELQSLMRIAYAVFCLNKKKQKIITYIT